MIQKAQKKIATKKQVVKLIQPSDKYMRKGRKSIEII